MDIILTQIICSVAAATRLLKLQLTVLLLLVVVVMVLVGWCSDDAVEVQLLEKMTDFAEDD